MKQITLAAFVMILSFNGFTQKFNGIHIDGELSTFTDLLYLKFKYRLIQHNDSIATLVSTENDTLLVKSKNSKVYTVINKIRYLMNNNIDYQFTRYSELLKTVYGEKDAIEDDISIFIYVKDLNMNVKLTNKNDYIELVYENKLNL